MVSKIQVGMSTTDMLYTNAKFIVNCKPRTLNDGGEEAQFTEYRNRKKQCFLAAAILLFFSKIIIT